MRKAKSVAVALAATAGMLLASPIAASAAATSPQESVYTYSLFEVSLPGTSLSAYFYLYTTFSQTQIWINGKVTCPTTPGWVTSWCSNTNNGQAYINAGQNLTSPSGSWYQRADIYANYSGCSWWGSSSLSFDYAECEVSPSSAAIQQASDLRSAPAILHRLTRIATLHLPTGTVYEWHMAARSVYERPGAVASVPSASSR
jgi:hypothetical protein